MSQTKKYYWLLAGEDRQYLFRALAFRISLKGRVVNFCSLSKIQKAERNPFIDT